MLSFTVPATTPAEATAYHVAGGATNVSASPAWPTDTTLQAQAIMRGQRAIAAIYNGRWTAEFDNHDAPDAVKHAIAEAALIEAATPGSLNAPAPDKVLTGAGKLSWTVTSAKPGAAAGKLPENIAGLLAGLVRPRGATQCIVRV